MPHIEISMYEGRSDELKREIAKKIKDAAVESCGFPPESLSVSIIDFPPDAFEGEVAKRSAGSELFEASNHIKQL